MNEKPECQLRRRRSSGNPNLPLNLEVSFQVNEGSTSQGTPSPGCFQGASDTKGRPFSAALIEFRKKQQSFDIQIEECEEEEIIVDSDDEEGGGLEVGATGVDRPVTPTPVQDFAANVDYSEGPQKSDFLKVKAMETDCYTDVSDAESDVEGEEEDKTL